MVKFKLNKQLDVQMAQQFLNTKFAGIDFGRSVWEYHQELRRINPDNTDAVSAYFNEFYTQNQEDLQKQLQEFETQWARVENEFLFATKKLFNNFNFPQGKYIGYLSTYNCNPRFLEDKTFQLFFRYMNCIAVTSHELMHFMFYAYTTHTFPKIFSELDTEKGLYWDIAEVFNNVVLSKDKIKEILNSEGDEGYPVHQHLIPHANELFDSSHNIDDFIIKLHDYIKQENY